jgi:hypothetical protein
LEQPVSKAVIQMIAELPNRVPGNCRLPEGVKPGESLAEENRRAVEEYRKNVRALGDRYSELRKHIVVGRSIFEYRGLLGKGRVWYDRHGTNRYRLHLGVIDLIAAHGSQGALGPYWVWFDDNGIIVEVEDILYGD